MATALQTTSNFDFLRGASHPEELVERACELGYDAIALTDRNSLAGIVRAYSTAKKLGIKFITGCRLDLTDGASLLAYPTDRAAYGQLCQLLSLGKMRAPKGECFLSFDDVCNHAEGMIFIALPPDDNQAFSATMLRNMAQQLPAPLYLGITRHHGGTDIAETQKLVDLAAQVGLETVALGDVLYHDPARRPLQDVVTCIREGCQIEQAGYRLNTNAERHLKAPTEMARLFKPWPQALSNAEIIAAQCEFSIDDLRYNYPEEPVPPGKTPQEHLEQLTWTGAAVRYPDGVPEKVEAAIHKELALIKELNYPQYFLTVYDIVQWARSQGILCQGRGSSANSAVCYCLHITSVNPAEMDLLIERFISAARNEPPDIDVDFEHERREEVMQYIYGRYGRERAGIAATVITYRGRSAVREVAKVMGLSEDVQGAMASTVWGSWGKEVDEQKVVEAGLDPRDRRIRMVLKLTAQLIGFPRHLSQHVGGFVLTQDRLVETVPIGNAAMADRTFIEWDKDDLAAAGLMKIDVLALGMLTCIQKSLGLMREHYGVEKELGDFFPANDTATYEMLQRADSLGVFQVESRAQMNMLPRLRPNEFYDLVIQVAIVRPGPIQGDMVHPYLRRRDGLEPVTFPSPGAEHGPPDELERILKRTMGVPIFQEQAMRIAIDAAKFSGDEANELRYAMATFRRRGTIEKLQAKMINRMIDRGYEPEFAERCFNQIKGFGEYGFPESHAASFSLLVYVSSWIKCHYPAVFCCALLNSQPMGFYAPAQIVRDAREHGVEMRPVDINHSNWDNTMEPCRSSTGGMAVRLGFRQVKGLNEDEMQTLIRLRDRGYDSIDDLHRRTRIKREQLEKLANADGFTSINRDRRSALWDIKALNNSPDLPLFSIADAKDTGAEQSVTLPEMSLSEAVVDDYQSLRLSLKAHPLSFLRDQFDRYGASQNSALKDMVDKQPVTVTGMAIVRQRPGSAKGVVFMTLEDETGIANVVVWPKVLEVYRPIVMGARLVLVHGKVQRTKDIIHVVADHIEDASMELLRLSVDERELRNPLARADEVMKPGPDPYSETFMTPGRYNVPEIIQDHPNAHENRRELDRADALVQRAHNDVLGRALPPNKAARPGNRKLPRFNPGMHPRQIRDLVPKSRDFH